MKKKLIGRKSSYVSISSLPQVIRQCMQANPHQEAEIKEAADRYEADQDLSGASGQEIEIAMLSEFSSSQHSTRLRTKRKDVGRKRG